jgi:hypothetical protein
MTQGVMTPPNPPSSPSTASLSGVARCWHNNAYFSLFSSLFLFDPPNRFVKFRGTCHSFRSCWLCYFRYSELLECFACLTVAAPRQPTCKNNLISGLASSPRRGRTSPNRWNSRRRWRRCSVSSADHPTTCGPWSVPSSPTQRTCARPLPGTAPHAVRRFWIKRTYGVSNGGACKLIVVRRRFRQPDEA